MELIGSQYDAYSGTVECAYKPGRTDYYAMGYVTAFYHKAKRFALNMPLIRQI